MEESIELWADEVRLGRKICSYIGPDHLLFAVSTLSLVLWSIKVFKLGEIGTSCVLAMRWGEVAVGWDTSVACR